MEQQTGSKLGKEFIKAAYCHPAYLTYMQSTSCEMPDWMKHKLESRLPSFKTKERAQSQQQRRQWSNGWGILRVWSRSWSDIPMCADHGRQDTAASSLWRGVGMGGGEVTSYRGNGHQVGSLVAAPVAQMVKTLPIMQETWVWSLGWEDPQEKEMAIHSSVSCLGNSMDRGAWPATVHGVTKSRTRLSVRHTGSLFTRETSPLSPLPPSISYHSGDILIQSSNNH